MAIKERDYEQLMFLVVDNNIQYSECPKRRFTQAVSM